MKGYYSCSIQRKKRGTIILAKEACDRDVTCLGFMTRGKWHYICTNSTKITASKHALRIKRNNEGKQIIIGLETPLIFLVFNMIFKH